MAPWHTILIGHRRMDAQKQNAQQPQNKTTMIIIFIFFFFFIVNAHFKWRVI